MSIPCDDKQVDLFGRCRPVWPWDWELGQYSEAFAGRLWRRCGRCGRPSPHIGPGPLLRVLLRLSNLDRINTHLPEKKGELTCGISHKILILSGICLACPPSIATKTRSTWFLRQAWISPIKMSPTVRSLTNFWMSRWVEQVMYRSRGAAWQIDSLNSSNGSHRRLTAATGEISLSILRIKTRSWRRKSVGMVTSIPSDEWSTSISSFS